jgi:hypothetical protein
VCSAENLRGDEGIKKRKIIIKHNIKPLEVLVAVCPKKQKQVESLLSGKYLHTAGIFLVSVIGQEPLH